MTIAIGGTLLTIAIGGMLLTIAIGGTLSTIVSGGTLLVAAIGGMLLTTAIGGMLLPVANGRHVIDDRNRRYAIIVSARILGCVILGDGNNAAAVLFIVISRTCRDHCAGVALRLAVFDFSTSGAIWHASLLTVTAPGMRFYFRRPRIEDEKTRTISTSAYSKTPASSPYVDVWSQRKPGMAHAIGIPIATTLA
jgi:hypothetical protein